MGGGVSSVIDPSKLRKEYETLAAKNVGDQELLNHMKKLILSPPTANKPVEKTAASNPQGRRRSSVIRGSASAPNIKGTAAGSPVRRGSGVPGEAAAGNTTRRGSASRPTSHNSRLSCASNTQASQQRRGSNDRRQSVDANRRGSNDRRQSVDGDRPLSAPPTKAPVPKQQPRSSRAEQNEHPHQSVDGDRPLSAPPTKAPVPKQRPRSSRGELNDASFKPNKSRRRSYLGQPTTGGGGDAVSTGGGSDAVSTAVEAAVAVAVAVADDVAPAQDDPAQDANKMQVDSWESVSQQPSCPLCHMVFSTEGKRDQHIKYSPAHAPPAEGSGPQPAPEPTMDSITIYSGTKLFWRTRLDVELFMQQHKTASAVQVLVFDVGTSREIAQVWISWNNVVAKLDPKEMKKEMEAADRAFHNLGMKPTPENVAAEATRKTAVSFIVKRIQVDEIVGEGVELGSSKSYKVSMMPMAADNGVNDLLVDQPEGVNPMFSRALMKRASMQEVSEVMTSLRQSLGAVNKDAQAAVASLSSAEGTVQQGRRGSVEVARRASIQKS